MTNRGLSRTASSYLPALDGLRAIAVLAVVLFHFGASRLSGGFLGVDVFFVLSGYLITSQLWVRWYSDRPSLRSFWAGRVRRLLPAVLALIVFTSVAMVIAGRDQLRSFVGDLAAAGTYTSNWWYVLHQRSYFEASGRPPVLQHLWSLAVEEQFYLLWPLVVAGCVLTFRDRPLARRLALIATAASLAVASAVWMYLGSSAAGVPQAGDPSRWYFGTDSHAMGLLLGAALAAWRAGRGFSRERGALPAATLRSNLSGVLALGGILAAFVLVSESSISLYRWGFGAIAVATAVLIASVTRTGWLQQLLSNAPMRWFGTRSYGLYLWHWPVACFTRPQLDVPFDGWQLFVLRSAVALGLTELSYRFIETPMRRMGWRQTWTALKDLKIAAPAAAATAALALIVVSLAAHPSSSTAAQNPVPTASLAPEARTSMHHKTANTELTVYGDSVALGAAPALRSTFKKVDLHATVGAQSWDLLPSIKAAAAQGKIASDTILLHTGGNGVVNKQMLCSTLKALSNKQRVVIVTPRVPRGWQDQNVKTIRGSVDCAPNVRLADWYAESQGRPEYLVKDGVHLSSTGIAAYLRLVQPAIAS